MLLIATSDKGGTGRSVTGSNIVYQRALLGDNACYVDFDFGSPTAGAVFGISPLALGTSSGQGTHAFLQSRARSVEECDIWERSDRFDLRLKPPGSGRLVLIPGDTAGGEFPSSADAVDRCVELFLRLQEEFDIAMVDLSAGRSYAAEIVLAATASPQLAATECRWLVFHRWTRQHIIAAHGLVRGEAGLVKWAVENGMERDEFLERVRYVRTAFIDPRSGEDDDSQHDAPPPRSALLEGLRPAQVAWLLQKNRELQSLADRYQLGEAFTIGTVPLDPVLQWQEQLITDSDVWSRHVANKETLEAFAALAKKVDKPEAWDRL